MTREEVIKCLKSLLEVRRKYGAMQTMKDEAQCLDMAIKALEQERSMSAEITQYRHDCKKLMEENERLKKALEQESYVDCISRQAALDTFGLSERSRKYGGDHSGYDTIMLYEVQDALEALPSVNTQEPCEDCISRQAVLDGLASIAKVKARSDAQKSLMGRIMFFVEQLPPVTPEEKTGKWIDDEFGSKCSRCGTYTHLDKFDRPMKFKYCSMCGAKMKEAGNDT